MNRISQRPQLVSFWQEVIFPQHYLVIVRQYGVIIVSTRGMTDNIGYFNCLCLIPPAVSLTVTAFCCSLTIHHI